MRIYPLTAFIVAVMLADRIGQFSSLPDPFFVERDDRAVNITDLAVKSVAFIGIKKDDRFHPRATGFFVSYIEDQHRFEHLVTAEHVISGLLKLKCDIWLRVNIVGGKTAEMRLDPQSFHYHPDNAREATDVAVCPMPMRVVDVTGNSVLMDVATLPLNDQDGFIATEEFARQYMGRGGDIAIIGLFRSHFGANRNIPIVRVGSISMLPEEPVFTRYAGYIKAYLVEARSIAGLSGSPVFALADLAMELSNALAHKRGKVQGSALLGLMHGHFDVPNLNEDVVTDEGEPPHGVHTGIGIVIPTEKILETINHPDLVAMRKKIVRDLRQSGATPDLATNDTSVTVPPTSEENPNHLEDFNRLVDVAARKRLRGDQS